MPAELEKENAAPSASVGADAGQQFSNKYDNTIPDAGAESNENFDRLLRKMRQMNNPDYLHTVSLNELFDNVYESRPSIIDGLLYAGAYFLAGAPNVGKSFLMAQLTYHVEVQQGTVLYLALEDDYGRLQGRMSRMFGVGGEGSVFFSVQAKLLSDGLDGQLEYFVREHPDTKLIVLDTLQKVREASGEAYSYRDDYQIIGQLKQLADRFKLCMLVVHHTRKSPANDEFDRISGTTGIYGCADGAFVLSKERRTDNTATLSISGRDQPDQCLHLVRNEETLQWNFDHADTELYKEPPDPLLEKVAALVTEEHPTWQGSATELIAGLGLELKPNALAMRLNVRAAKLKNDYGIRYENTRTHAGRIITLTKISPVA